MFGTFPWPATAPRPPTPDRLTRPWGHLHQEPSPPRPSPSLSPAVRPGQGQRPASFSAAASPAALCPARVPLLTSRVTLGRLGSRTSLVRRPVRPWPLGRCHLGAVLSGAAVGTQQSWLEHPLESAPRPDCGPRGLPGVWLWATSVPRPACLPAPPTLAPGEAPSAAPSLPTSTPSHQVPGPSRGQVPLRLGYPTFLHVSP